MSNIRGGFVAAWLAFAGSTLAADIRVPEDVPGIQAAIALAEENDTILVGPGTWAERVDFMGKSITLRSTNGPEQTVIDGEGATGFVIRISDVGEAALVGFTVTGGHGEGGSLGAGPGGGIIINGASATLSNLVIEANKGVLGGGIHSFGSTLVLADSVIRDNQSLQGGGLYAEGGSVDILDSEFINNESVNFGGAVALLGTPEARIERSRFLDNTASGFGGALYANHAGMEVRGSDFIGNGRAEALPDGVSWLVLTGGGGAVYVTGGHGLIESSRLLDNVAAFGSGLYVAGGINLQIVNTLLAGNGRLCNCGTAALYANSASPQLINSTLADNGGFATVYTTYNAFPSVVNSVLAGNEVATAGNGNAALSWTSIDSPAFSATLGDGVFQAEAMLDPDADYRPLPGSLLIDAGNNAAVPDGVVTDLLDQPRFFDDPDSPDTGAGDAPLVDIGAVEFQPASATHSHVFGDSFEDF